MTDEQRQNVANYMANFEVVIGVVSKHLEDISTGAITASRMALQGDESSAIAAIRMLLESMRRIRDGLDEDVKKLEQEFDEILESRPKSESETSQT